MSVLTLIGDCRELLRTRPSGSVNCNARRKEMRSEFRGYRVNHHSGSVDADTNKIMAEVPVDTRTPQQIQMGEPQWERSALYRKQMSRRARDRAIEAAAKIVDEEAT